MGPTFCKTPGRVLLHLLMVGWLSQVMDKANGSVKNGSVVNKDNPERTSQVVGVIKVHEDFVNMMNKSIEPVCAHVVNEDCMDMDGLVDNENVNVVSVDSMDENNPEQGLTSQDCVNMMNKDTEPDCAQGVKTNMGVVVVPAIHPAVGFVRKIRIPFLNCCKGKYHLFVCVKQISKFGDHLEIILITLKATENLLASP